MLTVYEWWYYAQGEWCEHRLACESARDASAVAVKRLGLFRPFLFGEVEDLSTDTLSGLAKACPGRIVSRRMEGEPCERSQIGHYQPPGPNAMSRFWPNLELPPSRETGFTP